jgi:glycolate oxidase iron-sulfur subunit
VRFVETDKLLSCVHCGLCLSSCPTYVEIGAEADSPRGRILLMRALEEGRVAPTPEVTRHLDTCLGCRACETACPSGVPYGSLIEAARPFVESRRPPVARLARLALGAVLTRPSLRALAMLPVRAVAGRSWLRGLARRLGGTFPAYAAALPSPRLRAPLPPVLEPEGSARGTALLLTGCVAHDLFGATNVAIAQLLARAGVRVLAPPGQGCCGALSAHLGHHDRATALARDVVALAARTRPDWVVATAAGCGALLREYDHLLASDAGAADVARRARDPLALLAELGLPPARHALPHAVAVHDPCHLAHAQGVRGEVRTLLRQVPGLRLVELEESDFCCGSAGTYNLTEPALAARLLERKLGHVTRSGAEILVAANPGCLLQIRSGAIARGLPVRVEHPADLLAAAHGIAL